MRVAYLGPEGTHSDEALRASAPPETEAIPYPTIYDAVMAVEDLRTVVDTWTDGTLDLAAPCASRPYAAPAARALERTVRGVLASVVGLTQASRV